MRNFTKSLLALALMFVCVGGAKAESTNVTRLALTGMTNWGPEYTLIERSDEVLSGGDIVSATYTASASYRDCISYTDLDVSDYDCLEIVTTDATTGTWQICFKADGGGVQYRGHSGTSTIINLSDVSIFTDFHFRSDTKGGDGENEPSVSNQSVIRIVKVSLLHKKETRTITIGATGFATYTSNKPISVDGVVTAYAAKYSGGRIVLTLVVEIPAGAGVIIEATAGDYIVPVIENAAALGAVNELVVSDGSAVSDGTFYALGKKDAKVGFIKVKSGVKIPAGKAYLVIAAGGARDFFSFDEDDTTALTLVNNEKSTVNSVYFNLAGQRVVQPTKGLYIVNGKKVIIK